MSSVVLPQPEGPMRTTSSPGSIVREMSTTAGRASSPLSNRLLTWSNRISVAALGAPASACPCSSMAHRPYARRQDGKSATGGVAYVAHPDAVRAATLLSTYDSTCRLAVSVSQPPSRPCSSRKARATSIGSILSGPSTCQFSADMAWSVNSGATGFSASAIPGLAVSVSLRTTGAT